MESGGGTDRKLHEIANAQRGVFSLAQATDAGVARNLVLERHAGRRLFRVYRGAYSLLRTVGREGVWWAGVLAAGEGSVLSHMSALRLWGITNWVGPTEVIRPASPDTRNRADGPDLR